MGLLQEFKKFALKGNVIDMAVGIVIGASFTKIVNSLVADIITPVIGAITSGKDFTDLFFWIGDGAKPATYAATKAPDAPSGVAIGFGSFTQATIDFLIVAAAMFLVIKLMNRPGNPGPQAGGPPPARRRTSAPPEIRDSVRPVKSSSPAAADR
jgi:large conductance mechanosensitive channel